MAHALEHDETSARDALGRSHAATDVNQVVHVTVHHQGRHGDLAQLTRPTSRRRSRAQLARHAGEVEATVVGVARLFGHPLGVEVRATADDAFQIDPPLDDRRRDRCRSGQE